MGRSQKRRVGKSEFEPGEKEGVGSGKGGFSFPFPVSHNPTLFFIDDKLN